MFAYLFTCFQICLHVYTNANICKQKRKHVCKHVSMAL
ncbi:hypothetical protein B4096_1429 [Heyndrickxia coagulans]|nr:hypothetical protein B4096_1429 [Heyndrickxia coagulans]